MKSANPVSSHSLTALLERAASGERITPAEGVTLYRHADLLDLGAAASRRCRDLHPDGTVTFLIDRNINYTNVCENRCRFCAFYRDPDSPEAYLLSHEEIEGKVAEASAQGATQIMLQGGLHPELDLPWFTSLFRSIKGRYDLSLHSLSPPEILFLAGKSGLSTKEVLKELAAAGLTSLPGGGAEILVDRVRKLVSPKKIDSRQWLAVMESAHDLGLPTTATMMLGAGELLEERFEHLSRLRDLQDRTSGFLSFIPWTFQPENTAMPEGGISSLAYLRMLAASRLFLDNIANLQGSWVTQGPEVGQLTLSFGANDLGSIMLEENVVRAAGTSHSMTKERMIRLISESRHRPARRDTVFNTIETCG